MSTWAEAQAAAEREIAGEPPAAEPATVSLIVVDHFDLTMVDMNASGARLLVRPLTRLEAIALVRASQHRFAVVAMNERGQGLLERELQLEPVWRPKVGPGTRLLVVHAARWNDIRWHLVEYEADGDGCVP